MCDAFLVLAQAPGGLSCFLLPRFTPDGERNRFPHPAAQGQARQPLERLERGGIPRRLGAARGRGRAGRADHPGDGQSHAPRLRHRLGCAACAGARRGRSITPAHRRAFGKLLIDQPLMRNVLADLAIESEAATVAMMRLARAYDPDGEGGDEPLPPPRHGRPQVLGLQAGAGARGRGPGMPGRQRLRGGMGPRPPLPRGAAQRDLGGLGQRPVPGRAARPPEVPRVAGRLLRPRSPRPAARTRGWTPSLTRSAGPTSGRTADLESRARHLVERLALALQASLLVRHAPSAVAEAFCATRLGGEGGRAFGTLPSGTDFGGILERAG